MICSTRSLLIIILTFLTSPAYSSAVVYDGDTFTLDGSKIRLWGIDAPELHQPCQASEEALLCGLQSKQKLQSIIGNKDIICIKVTSDKYKRLVARCTVDGLDVAEELVKSGWAIDYPQYSKGFFSSAEQFAKTNNLGIWAYKFEKPWYWRSLKKNNRVKHQ